MGSSELLVRKRGLENEDWAGGQQGAKRVKQEGEIGLINSTKKTAMEGNKLGWGLQNHSGCPVRRGYKREFGGMLRRAG